MNNGNYTSFRNQFKSVTEFEIAYGKLDEEEVHRLIDNTETSITCKAAMMTVWHRCREKYSDDNYKTEGKNEF